MISKTLGALAFLAWMTASAIAAEAATLDVSVYNPGVKAIFAVSSELVAGPHEVLLVDAQFGRKEAEQLVSRIEASGKTLKTVYISHSDPDYYFGLQTIHAAFPDARIVATPQTVAAIKASKDGKLAYWGPILKDDAPTAIVVPEALVGDTLTVDDVPVKIIGLDGATPDRTFLWVPSGRAVIGGIPVVANEHVWIADTRTPASRVNWKHTLDAIAALKPTLVVPGHFALNPDGTEPLNLDAFETEAAKAKDAAALISAMERRYPKLSGTSSLEISAKVVKGEMKWPAE